MRMPAAGNAPCTPEGRNDRRCTGVPLDDRKVKDGNRKSEPEHGFLNKEFSYVKSIESASWLPRSRH